MCRLNPTSDLVRKQLLQLRDQWQTLKQTAAGRTRALGGARSLQEFNTKVDKLEAWIKEKVKLKNTSPPTPHPPPVINVKQVFDSYLIHTGLIPSTYYVHTEYCLYLILTGNVPDTYWVPTLYFSYRVKTGYLSYMYLELTRYIHNTYRVCAWYFHGYAPLVTRYVPGLLGMYLVHTGCVPSIYLIDIPIKPVTYWISGTYWLNA